MCFPLSVWFGVVVIAGQCVHQPYVPKLAMPIAALPRCHISGATTLTFNGSAPNKPITFPSPPLTAAVSGVRDEAAFPRPLAVALGKQRQPVQTQGGRYPNEDVYRAGKKWHEQTWIWTHKLALRSCHLIRSGACHRPSSYRHPEVSTKGHESAQGWQRM